MNFIQIGTHEDGNSFITDMKWPLFDGAFTPPSASGYLVSETISATGILMMHHPAGYQDEWHCAPSTVLGTIMNGEVRIFTSDGDSRLLRPGDQFVANDLTGFGHKMEEINSAPYNLALVILTNVSSSHTLGERV